MKILNNIRPYLLLVLLLPLVVVANSYSDESIPEKGASYLFKTWEYQISDGAYVGKVHFRKIIYNTLGEEYNRASFYENDAKKVKNVKLKVLSINGKVLYTREKKNFNKQCGYGSAGGYDDDCAYYLDAEASEFPYIIDLEYTVECKSLFYLSGAVFQHFIPVDSISYTVHSSDGTLVHSKLYGTDIQPLISEYDGATSYQWVLNNIPALESINYLPPDARQKIRLRLICEGLALGDYVLPDVSWKGIGQWYNELYNGKCNIVVPNETFSTQEIYNDVIDNIRYVAIEIGVGGWQPYDAALTESRAFGDCKDMSTLLVSKLRNQNIKAYPVIVLTHGNGRIDPEFPSLNFNHVITVAIDGNDTTWMDPTCNSCAFGELPRSDEDIDVLVVTEDGGVLRRTPASKPEENQTLRKTSMKILADQSVEISCQYKLFGNYGRNMRDYLSDKTKDEKKEFLTSYINGDETLFSLNSFSFENFDDITEPFIMNVKALTKKKVDRIGKKWYVNPYLFFREKNIRKVITADREYAINLGYPDKVVDSIIIQLDSTIQVDSVKFINADSIETSFNSFATNIKQIDNNFYCLVTKETISYQISPSQFKEYELYYKDIKKITSKYIKLYTK